LHFLILGIILVLVVIFTPRGFMDLFRKGFSLSRLLSGVKANRV